MTVSQCLLFNLVLCQQNEPFQPIMAMVSFCSTSDTHCHHGRPGVLIYQKQTNYYHKDLWPGLVFIQHSTRTKFHSEGFFSRTISQYIDN